MTIAKILVLAALPVGCGGTKLAGGANAGGGAADDKKGAGKAGGADAGAADAGGADAGGQDSGGGGADAGGGAGKSGGGKDGAGKDGAGKDGSGKDGTDGGGDAAGNDSGGNDSGGNDSGTLSVDEGEANLIDVPITVVGFQGQAAGTNCVFVGINAKRDLQVTSELSALGCAVGQTGKNTYKTVVLKARAKPFCNVIRVVSHLLEENKFAETKKGGTFKPGAATPIAGLVGGRFFPVAGGLRFEINDNADNKEDKDVIFEIKGLDTIDFAVENSPSGCKP